MFEYIRVFSSLRIMPKLGQALCMASEADIEGRSEALLISLIREASWACPVLEAVETLEDST